MRALTDLDDLALERLVAERGGQPFQARQVLHWVWQHGVDQFEQMRSLRASTSIPLAVDEASVGPADFFRYASRGLVDYLVVKVTRSGGIWPSVQQIAIAEAAGLPLLVSGLTDGFLTKMAVCQMALAFGFAGPAALNGSQFTDDSALFPTKGQLEYAGSVHLNDAPGIGVEPDEAALRALAA